MNEHPVSNKYNFKDSIYKYSFSKLIIIFLSIFSLFSLIFFAIYFVILQDNNIDTYKIFKFSLFQSFGYSINDIIPIELSKYDFINFIQKTTFIIINLIFTSSIIFKYFNKPDFFQFKKKLNIHNNKLIISFYNRTNFDITSCNIKVYARLPYKDDKGFRSLNNIELSLKNSFFPFMDQHLVTRLNIDISDDNKNIGLLKMLNTNKEFIKEEREDLQISVIIEAISSTMDSHIYEIKTYRININDIQSIKDNVTFDNYKGIDIDMVDFSKSVGWKNFED